MTITYIPAGQDPQEALSTLLSTLPTSGILALDVETNGLDLEDPRHEVRTIQLGTQNAAVILSAVDQVHRDAARSALMQATYWTAHNAAFDIGRLTSIGVFTSIDEGWSRMIDTLVLTQILEPPSDKQRAYAGLKNQTEVWAPEVARSATAKEALLQCFAENKWKGLSNGWDAYSQDDPRTGNGWAQVDPASPVMQTYAAADVLDGANLAERLYPLATWTNSESAAREHRIARLCSGMSYRGVRLDVEYTRELREQYREEEEHQAGILREMGVENPGSVAQVSAILESEGIPLIRTDKGNVKTDDASLQKYIAAGSSIAGPLAEYRRVSKLRSTYLDRYLRSGSDRIHADVKPLEAATGRMAVSNPSLQNVPRGGGIRECFIADEGNVLVSADFSSVEMRVAAALGQDQALMEDYANGECPYWAAARTLYGPDATKENRQNCKAVVLGRMYGGGIATLARQTGLPESEIKAVAETFDARHPGLTTLKENYLSTVKKGTPTWVNDFGRRQQIDPGFSYKILNYGVQGYARDLLVEAIFRVEDAGLADRMWLPIHDELIIQAPENEAEEYAERLTSLMSTTLMGVEIPAEAEILGTHWRK